MIRMCSRMMRMCSSMIRTFSRFVIVDKLHHHPSRLDMQFKVLGV
jgi:hypothetical protein